MTLTTRFPRGMGLMGRGGCAPSRRAALAVPLPPVRGLAQRLAVGQVVEHVGRGLEARFDGRRAADLEVLGDVRVGAEWLRTG